MRRKLSDEILKDRLYALIESETLEFVRDLRDSSILRIPYMMSDAVEDYLEFTNVSIVGEIPRRNIRKQDGGIENDIHSLIITDADILDGEIAFRAGLQPVFTLRYDAVTEWRELYQYHRTGHYWVQGAEHIRRVFYILSLIYDKIQYLGPDAGNDSERRLAKLVEFGPLRYWSPTRISMEDWYVSTKEGNRVMEEIAREAGDRRYANMVALFNSLPSAGQKEKLAKYLAESKGEKLYRYIISLIEEASAGYPARSYGADNDIRIQGMRRRIQNDLERRDFEGKWPHFRREEQLVTIIEEQPFTILDSPDAKYNFYMDVTLRSFLHPEHHVEDLPERSIALLPPGMTWEEFRRNEKKEALTEAAKTERAEKTEEPGAGVVSVKIKIGRSAEDAAVEVESARRSTDVFRELEAQKDAVREAQKAEEDANQRGSGDVVYEELKKVYIAEEEPSDADKNQVALELTRVAREMQKLNAE
jgi:hypothetical protein